MLGIRANLTAIARAAILAGCFAVSAQAETPVSLGGAFPDETQALLTATSTLFDEVEAGATSRQKKPVISIPRLIKPVSSDPRDAFESHGRLRHLTGYRVSWYPTDRLLGSVDFMGTWDGNRNLVCGYVTWDLSEPGAPVLEQVSANYLDVSSLSGMSDARIHSALLEANCAFGAIDPNYTLFDPAG